MKMFLVLLLVLLLDCRVFFAAEDMLHLADGLLSMHT
jgi:hypothetical protein